MGKHTKGHVSLESRFAFVEGPLHSKAMFEGGDPRLNARPPCLSTPEPALLLADRALSTQRASSRQNYLLNSQFCSQSLILRARITAISRRQPRGPAKEGNMVLERRCPLLLVSPVARSHFIPADDPVFDLIDAHQASKLVGFMRLAFADDDAVGFEQAQDLLWIMPLGLEDPRLSLRDHPLDQWQIMVQRALLAQHPQHRIGPRTEFSTESPARTAPACEVTARVTLSKRP